MKVKIVDKKDGVKEMTFEELAEEEFIGGVWGGKKGMINTCSGYRTDYNFHWTTVGCKGGVSWRSYKTKREMLQENSLEELHVFDTAKELYLWMAE